MSDPVALPSGQQVQNTQQTVGIGQTFAAQPLARSDAPVAAATAGPLTTSEQATIRAELAKPGAKFADVMNSFWSARATSAPPPGTDAKLGTDDPAQSQQNDQPAGEITEQQLDELVKTATDGKHGGEAITSIDSFARPFAEEMMKLDDKAFNARFDAGIAQVEKEIYGGDVEAYAEGIGLIAKAAYRLQGAEGGKRLLAEIDRSGILSNPGAHFKILNLARAITGWRPSMFRR